MSQDLKIVFNYSEVHRNITNGEPDRYFIFQRILMSISDMVYKINLMNDQVHINMIYESAMDTISKYSNSLDYRLYYQYSLNLNQCRIFAVMYFNNDLKYSIDVNTIRNSIIFERIV